MAMAEIPMRSCHVPKRRRLMAMIDKNYPEQSRFRPRWRASPIAIIQDDELLFLALHQDGKAVMGGVVCDDPGGR